MPLELVALQPHDMHHVDSAGGWAEATFTSRRLFTKAKGGIAWVPPISLPKAPKQDPMVQPTQTSFRRTPAVFQA